MKVSFVIRTLNEGKTLGEVLRRIQLLDDSFEKEIVIVDSGSSDNTIDIAKKYNAKIIRISQSEWSWGKSLNMGIENSSGDFIAVISGHCFISKKDFLEKSISLFNNNDEIAAVYGGQLPIPKVDPFEEYELHMWFPNIEKYVMNYNTLKYGKGIGISNACCVLKKDAWFEVKFNEKVESAEDGVWAFDTTKNGYKLIYSNTFGVFHSHPLNVEYIYRKWYWRNYEWLRIMPKYMDVSNKEILRKFIKKYLYREYLYVRSLREKRKMKRILNKYDFVTDRHIMTFLCIRNSAIVNSYNDYMCSKKKGYWSLDVPKEIVQKQLELKDLEKYLDGEYSFLEDIK